VHIPEDSITHSGGIRSGFRGIRSGIGAKRRGGFWSAGGEGGGGWFESLLLAARGPAELNHVGVVDEPVADGVGNSRITDGFVPTFRRQLSGDDCRGLSVAVFEHLEDVASLEFVERVKQEVVKDQKIQPGELLERGGVLGCYACDR